MSAPEATTLVGGLGFPIFLVVAMLLFVDRRLWPSVIVYLEKRAEESRKRHDSWIDTVNRFNSNNEAMARMMLVLDAKIDASTQTGQANHAVTLQKIERIEATLLTKANNA